MAGEIAAQGDSGVQPGPWPPNVSMATVLRPRAGLGSAMPAVVSDGASLRPWLFHPPPAAESSFARSPSSGPDCARAKTHMAMSMADAKTQVRQAGPSRQAWRSTNVRARLHRDKRSQLLVKCGSAKLALLLISLQPQLLADERDRRKPATAGKIECALDGRRLVLHRVARLSVGCDESQRGLECPEIFKRRRFEEALADKFHTTQCGHSLITDGRGMPALWLIGAAGAVVWKDCTMGVATYAGNWPYTVFAVSCVTRLVVTHFVGSTLATVSGLDAA